MSSLKDKDPENESGTERKRCFQDNLHAVATPHTSTHNLDGGVSPPQIEDTKQYFTFNGLSNKGCIEHSFLTIQGAGNEVKGYEDFCGLVCLS